MKCDICDDAAVYKASGGPVRETADAAGDSMGIDRPYPKNKTYRCKKHQDQPDGPFGRLWRWERID